MSCLTGTYTSGAALLEALHAFLIKGHTLRPQYTGIGNGYTDDMVGTINSVHEIITVTLTSATTFIVNGSASGDMGPGVVGSLFSHDRLTFTLTQGTINFASGDSLVVQMTAPWEILAYSAGQAYFYQAPGNDGNQNVNVGWTVKSNVTGGYFNARIGAYPSWFSQNHQWRKHDASIWTLGAYTGSPVKLWAQVTGQYIYAVARVGTVYCAMCVGYFDTVHTFDQYPAPYIVGGSLSFQTEPADTSTTWAYNGNTIASPVHPLYGTSTYYYYSLNSGGSVLYLRDFTNNWIPVAKFNGPTDRAILGLTPIERGDAEHNYYQVDWRNTAPNLDDSIPLYNIEIKYSLSNNSILNKPNLYGYLPSVYKFPLYNKEGTLVSSESTFRDPYSRIKYVILNTGTNIGDVNSFYALEQI